MMPYYLLIWEDPLDTGSLNADWFPTFEEAWKELEQIEYTSTIYRYSGGSTIDMLSLKTVGLGSTRGTPMYSIREILEKMEIPVTDKPYEHIQSKG